MLCSVPFLTSEAALAAPAAPAPSGPPAAPPATTAGACPLPPPPRGPPPTSSSRAAQGRPLTTPAGPPPVMIVIVIRIEWHGSARAGQSPGPRTHTRSASTRTDQINQPVTRRCPPSTTQSSQTPTSTPRPAPAVTPIPFAAPAEAEPSSSVAPDDDMLPPLLYYATPSVVGTSRPAARSALFPVGWWHAVCVGSESVGGEPYACPGRSGRRHSSRRLAGRSGVQQLHACIYAPFLCVPPHLCAA